MDRTVSLLGKSKRCSADIFATIIGITQNSQSTFTIMQKAHINSEQLKLYLEELIKLELIHANCTNMRKTYSATPQGIKYLRQYQKLQTLLK
jgi:predicted transcriptional regulator